MVEDDEVRAWGGDMLGAAGQRPWWEADYDDRERGLVELIVSTSRGLRS
jgi:hypothetical protein